MIRNERAPRISIDQLRVAAVALERYAAREPAHVSDAMLILATQARAEADQKERDNAMRRQVNLERIHRRRLYG